MEITCDIAERTIAALARLQRPGVTADTHTQNLARNFHVNLLSFEIWSLQLQRLWRQSKTDRGKLRATFG